MFSSAFPSCTSLSRKSLLLIGALAAAAIGISAPHAAAQNPDTGTIGPSGPTQTWQGAAPGGASVDESTCEEDVNCETYVLTVTGSVADWKGKKVAVEINWGTGDTDYDLFIHKGEDPNAGPLVGSSAQGGTTNEATSIDPAIVGTGKFSVRVVYFVGSSLLDAYTGTAKIASAPVVEPTPPGASPTPTPFIPGAPRFHNFPAPPGVAEDAGEPSNGINWNTEQKFSNSMFTIPNGGTSTYYGGFLPYMLKVTFDDCASPAGDLWEQKQLTLVNAPRVFGDPILFTDSITGRTFVSQELGLSPAGSTTEFTDDDGDTFFPSEGSGAPSGIDHQTIGGGPFAPGLGPVTDYPHAVYYASQSVADAVCSVSVDGGITFGPAVPMYTIAQCSGLHGHLKVAPDGTVYVPNRACGGSLPFHDGGEPAVVVSEDNGITWNVRPVKGGTTRGDRDPSVGIAKDGTIYLGWQAANGHANIASSKDKGKTWSPIKDVGAQVGVENIVFSAVVAGDGDRASYTFYGTETPGDDYDQPAFPGVWYLYHAATFDGGKTWTTTNLTPNDPVQRGGICGDGTCRNLLDFFRSEIDKQGRVVIGWDDGCTGGCVQGPPNSFVAKAVISRQSGGKRMFADKDPVEPAIPQAPALKGSIDPENTAVSLKWEEPDNSGSPITSYRVFRRAGQSGPYTLLATVKQETSYTDTTFNKSVKNFYRLTAVNAEGESPFCNEFSPEVVVAANVCDLPGALVIDDSNPDGSDADTGANVPIDPRVNVQKLFVAEPFVGPGVNQLVFTLKVAESSSSSAPPNSQWYVIWNREAPAADGSDRMYVAMKSDVTGAVSFEYGNFGPPLDPTNPPPNANTPTKVGDIEGSYDPATGVIRMTIANSKIENKQPGKDLTGLNVRTYFNRPDPGQRSQNNASDITGDSSYSLRGNASCLTNKAPLAALVATPRKGRAHLEVSFDASGSSDPDAGGSIAEYAFNFGDGSPIVKQSNPKVKHTYTRGGFFIATLTVKDAQGLKSLNIARQEIQTFESLQNISSRAHVKVDNNVAIGGFIIQGNAPKKVIVRGLGPSLKNDGAPIPGRLQDPTIDLYRNGVAVPIASNDNWKAQEKAVRESGIPPSDNREAAIVRTLEPGAYTVVLRGKNRSTGIGLVEIYDLAPNSNSRLGNISTRAFIETGDNALIGGFIAGPSTAGGIPVVVRALGPSLKGQIPQALNDPRVQVINANGTVVAQNDNWKSDQRAAIQKTGLAPSDDRESAILIPALSPGPYTAIVRGKGDSTGVGMVEVYGLE